MTSTTAITPSDQDLQLRWPTALVPEHLDTAVVTDGTVPTGNTTSVPTQTGQPEPGVSTLSTSPAQVRPVGLAQITGLDKWEGKVLEVEGDIFTAELFPIDREGISITADFDLELLGSDAATIVPGDVFYLSVRTVKAYGMRPARTENLRLRRLGRITPEEVQAAYAKADALMERLEQLFD
jgi:hypothetical protein